MYRITKKHLHISFPPLSLRKVWYFVGRESKENSLVWGKKKKQLMTLGCITAARPSWSLNNLGLLRGFILWSGVLIYFRLVVVLHCYMKRQSLRCNQQLAICGGGGGRANNLNNTSLAYFHSHQFWYSKECK